MSGGSEQAPVPRRAPMVSDMDENPLTQVQRDNVAKAVALLTAMDANRTDTTFFAKVAVSYIYESKDVEASLGNAVDLVSGLAVVATGLLSMVEDATGTSRPDILSQIAKLGI